MTDTHGVRRGGRTEAKVHGARAHCPVSAESLMEVRAGEVSLVEGMNCFLKQLKFNLGLERQEGLHHLELKKE